METNRGEQFVNQAESEAKFDNPGIMEVLKFLREKFLNQETK